MRSDTLEKFFPSYLCEGTKAGLLGELKQWNVSKPFFTKNFLNESDPIQGDICSGLLFFSFHEHKTRAIRGIVLSNTCDISNENHRKLPVNVAFCPIISIQKYRELWLASGGTDESFDQHKEDLTSQIITDSMFLPRWSKDSSDSVALFSEIQSVPRKALLASESYARHISLSQFGHWLLSLKLSIHFCRLNEGLDRDAD